MLGGLARTFVCAKNLQHQRSASRRFACPWPKACGQGRHSGLALVSYVEGTTVGGGGFCLGKPKGEQPIVFWGA